MSAKNGIITAIAIGSSVTAVGAIAAVIAVSILLVNANKVSSSSSLPVPPRDTDYTPPTCTYVLCAPTNQGGYPSMNFQTVDGYKLTVSNGNVALTQGMVNGWVTAQVTTPATNSYTTCQIQFVSTGGYLRAVGEDITVTATSDTADNNQLWNIYRLGTGFGDTYKILIQNVATGDSLTWVSGGLGLMMSPIDYSNTFQQWTIQNFGYG